MYRSPFEFIVRAPDDVTLHSDDDRFFVAALNAAHSCMGSTHPNPSVGAAIVERDRVISVGHTHAPGSMHAEVDALSRVVPAKDRTLFVTLEPCSHFGRTPPCTLAVIDAGIARVVYGVQDPNPRVFGAGFSALRAANIRVEQINNAELLARAEAQIAPFSRWIKEKRPWVTVKVATSSDFAIADRGQRTKITDQSSDEIVHRLRRAHDAIMVGAETVRIDDPVLTSRLGPPWHNTQPLRVVVSSDLNLAPTCALFDTTVAKTMILTTVQADHSKRGELADRGVSLVTCASRGHRVDLRDGLQKLAESGITSVLIEAGGALLSSLLEEQVIDEVWWFKADKLLGPDGTSIRNQLTIIQEKFTMHEHIRFVDDFCIFKN